MKKILRDSVIGIAMGLLLLAVFVALGSIPVRISQKLVCKGWLDDMSEGLLRPPTVEERTKIVDWLRTVHTGQVERLNMDFVSKTGLGTILSRRLGSIKSPLRLRDPWGNAFEMEVRTIDWIVETQTNGTVVADFEIRSMGPDGRRSSDDLIKMACFECIWSDDGRANRDVIVVPHK